MFFSSVFRFCSSACILAFVFFSYSSVCLCALISFSSSSLILRCCSVISFDFLFSICAFCSYCSFSVCSCSSLICISFLSVVI